MTNLAPLPRRPDHDDALLPDAAGDNVAPYVEALQMLERMHRLLLDLIKDEFERLGRLDLNPVQAMILFNMGEAEVSAGELRSRGMYQGSNVSYNLKKLVQMGYVVHERCDQDRRSVRVRLSDQGQAVRDDVMAMFSRHADILSMSGIMDDPPLPAVNAQTRRLERFWLDQIRYIY